MRMTPVATGYLSRPFYYYALPETMKMRFRTTHAATLTLCFANALLAGCGGGGSGDPAATAAAVTYPSAEGVYIGNIARGTSSEFQALVLPNGDMWSLYGYDSGSAFYVDGFAQGNGSSTNGTFTATLKDFGYLPAIPGTMTATYNLTDKTIGGTSTYMGRTFAFGGGPAPESFYLFDTPALVRDVVGQWNTMSTEGGLVSVNITANGAVTLSEESCAGTGTIAPHASGKNVFDISVTFGPAPCFIPNATVTGIVMSYPLATGQRQLIAAVTNQARTAGIAVFGIR